MTVSITISGESGGNPIDEITDFGTYDPGNASDAADLYIRHDAAVWQITDCAFYLVRYVGSESGTPDQDFADIIGWGDATIALNPDAHGVSEDPDYGGFYLNMNHSGGFPTADWHPFYTGRGNSADNAVILSQNAVNDTGSGWTPTDGEIPFQGEAHIKVREDIPANVEDAGSMLIQLVMTYSYTS